MKYRLTEGRLDAFRVGVADHFFGFLWPFSNTGVRLETVSAWGFIYGFLVENDPQEAVDYGCVHGAPAMTTPGDTTMASLKEVKKIKSGGGARVDRREFT